METTVIAKLNKLLLKEIKIILDENQTNIRVIGKVETLTNIDKQFIKENKAGIIELLNKDCYCWKNPETVKQTLV